jgi:hypothetical protein|tara:strand:- start:5307 stop:6386 length:1080 start_codon:yes stop_codon:yes gene_type:complete
MANQFLESLQRKANMSWMGNLSGHGLNATPLGNMSATLNAIPDYLSGVGAGPPKVPQLSVPNASSAAATGGKSVGAMVKNVQNMNNSLSSMSPSLNPFGTGNKLGGGQRSRLKPGAGNQYGITTPSAINVPDIQGLASEPSLMDSFKGVAGKAGGFLKEHQAGISAVAGGAMAVGGAYQKNKSLNKSIDEVNKAIKTLEGSKTEIGDRLRTDRELVLDEVSEEGQRNAVSEFSDLSNQTTAAVNANRSLSSGHLNKKVQEIQKASQTKLSNIYEAKKKDGQRKVDLLVSNAKVNTDKLTAHVGTMKDTRDEMKEAQSNIARNTALDVGSIALGATGIGLPAMFAMQMGMNALKEENQYS